MKNRKKHANTILSVEKPLSNVHAILHNPIFIISYIGDRQKELVQKNESNLWAETCLFLGVVCS